MENFYNQQREKFVQHLNKVKHSDNFENKKENFTNNLPEFKEKFLNNPQQIEKYNNMKKNKQ
jgi:hypothetical protein